MNTLYFLENNGSQLQIHREAKYYYTRVAEEFYLVVFTNPYHPEALSFSKIETLFYVFFITLLIIIIGETLVIFVSSIIKTIDLILINDIKTRLMINFSPINESFFPSGFENLNLMANKKIKMMLYSMKLCEILILESNLRF